MAEERFFSGWSTEGTNRPSKQYFNRKLFLLLATFSSLAIFSRKAFKGSPGSVATRPSKLDIPGNFFRSSDLIATYSKKSRNVRKTSFSYDPTPIFFISKSIRFWHIYLPKSFSRISLLPTTFLVSKTEHERILLAPAENSKNWRFLLLLFIVSIGTRSPSMEKENSQVKRCSFFKKIVANCAENRVFSTFLRHFI